MTTALERAMPTYDFRERHSRRIDADADAVWSALTALTPNQLWITRPLVAVRHVDSTGRFANRKLMSDGPVTMLQTVPPRYAIGGAIARVRRWCGPLIKVACRNAVQRVPERRPAGTPEAIAAISRITCCSMSASDRSSPSAIHCSNATLKTVTPVSAASVAAGSEVPRARSAVAITVVSDAIFSSSRSRSAELASITFCRSREYPRRSSGKKAADVSSAEAIFTSGGASAGASTSTIRPHPTRRSATP